MSLPQMSFSGGVLILAVIVLRSLALHRLPKGTFPALWTVAVLRLLVPFSIPSPASVYALAERIPVRENAVAQTLAPASPVLPAAPVAVPPPAGAGVDLWSQVWMAGALLCAGVFLRSYLRSRRMFRAAEPVEADWVPAWLERHRLRRPIAIHCSPHTGVPLTYGVLRPVILLPEGPWDDDRLEWVLEHELTHIRYFDGVSKLILVFTACVHWFNPLVWVMLALANRDMELRCDEAVVRRLGVERRGDYARALISMEERKSVPFASAFSESAIEERIIAIMKIRKRSLAAILAAAVLVCCIGVAFATSAAVKTEDPYPKAPHFTEEELDRLAALWFAGCEELTVADYRLWAQRLAPEDLALAERYSQNNAEDGIFGDPEAATPSGAFRDYFFYVYVPLTAEHWQVRTFPGVKAVRLEDGGAVLLTYNYTLDILNPEQLTVGEYRQAQADISAGVRALPGPDDPTEADFAALSRRLSTDSLAVTVEAPDRSIDRDGISADDADFYARISRETAANWTELLSPYTAFGLTYRFDDPDLDGNGLTMWFNGREVRGIYDEEEQIWITESTGISRYAPDAVELYTVYTDGVLSGLRLADPEEQAGFDEMRRHASAELDLLESRTAVDPFS